jgi:hypothetical protein
MAAINSAIKTDGFSSMEECNRARRNFNENYDSYIAWILAQSEERDWWMYAR